MQGLSTEEASIATSRTEESITYDRTDDNDANAKQMASFPLPSSGIACGIEISPATFKCENKMDDGLITWNRCYVYFNLRCGSWSKTFDSIYFNSGKVAYTPKYTEYIPLSFDEVATNVIFSIGQRQSTNTGSAFFHVWSTQFTVALIEAHISLWP